MLTAEDLTKLYPELAAPLPDEAIEETLASETKKGYNTVGYGCQYLINRMNEVLGPAHWRAKEEIINPNNETSQNAKPFIVNMKMTVQIGNPVCKVCEEKIIPYFEVIAEQTCYGGHVSYGTLADALKGAYTNSLKKTLALFGVGRQAYEGIPQQGNKKKQNNGSNQGQPPQGGQRPNQGQPPQGGQRPGQGQPPQGGQRPGQGQPPQGGQQPGQGQPPQGGQRPGQGQPPQGGQRPGQGQPPQGGQQPGQGQPPQGGQQPGQGQPPQGGQRPGQGQPPQGSQQTGQGQPPQGGQQTGQAQTKNFRFVPFEKVKFTLTHPVAIGQGPNGTTIANLIAVDPNGEIFEMRPDNRVFGQLDYFTALQKGQSLMMDGRWDKDARKAVITAVAN